jgi:hypothetical protein
MMEGNHPRKIWPMPTLNWFNHNKALTLATQAPHILTERFSFPH